MSPSPKLCVSFIYVLNLFGLLIQHGFCVKPIMRKSKSTGRFKWANFLNRFRLRLLESISSVHEFFNFLFLTPAMKFGESYGR